ncbi:PIN domain-containing protein [Amphiplicatus metriothermophilus]|uniref:Ribonuclease VapC n=1 Tax=Amphiplicatus metriothermophilus TaxID=1519374 RepID=A0A239Q0N6_9PROT|nr:PIN domain-containing protein [Amphiplicatus metriothermophilus]MBB5520031.1 ribonuclease VapC [Amphiplicatus metriothermophilus]SNT75786.1 ribonuclease VapC [Amphiplicatus metriothermophilus]
MFLDASAIMAVIVREPGFDARPRRLEESDSERFYSPLVRFGTILAPARIKTDRQGPRRTVADRLAAASFLFDNFAAHVEAKEIAISPAIAAPSLPACAIYGELSGHPARLNSGDCFAYACARELGVGLLYKGEDFSQTDLA